MHRGMGTDDAVGLVEALPLEVDMKIGIHDNFFELSGHFLYAARVLSWVRNGFGVALPVEAVFEAPTIAELAGRVMAMASMMRRPFGPEAVGERVEMEI